MSPQNILEIKILAESLLNGDVRRRIQLIIDGRDLLDRLREYEMPFATREEAPQIAGAYSDLDAEWTNSEHFRGHCDPLHACGENDERVALLECECGNAGCWPFVARITVTDTTVRWSDFEQPHRRINARAGWWDYSGFGPFEFARSAYETELKKIKA